MARVWVFFDMDKPTRVWAKVLATGDFSDELVSIEEVVRLDARTTGGFPARARMESIGRNEYHPLNRGNYALAQFRLKARQAKGALEKLNTLISKNTSWDPRYERTVAYVLWKLIEKNTIPYDQTDYNAVQDQSKSRFRRTLAYRPNLTHPKSYQGRYLRSIA